MKNFLLASLILPMILFGASESWTGGGAPSTDWGSASNWTPAQVPLAGDTATFSTPGSGHTSVTVGEAQSVGFLVFDFPTPYTLSGIGPLNLSSGTVSGPSSISVYTTTGTAGAPHSIQVSNIQLLNSLIVNQNGPSPTGTFSISGVIGGTAQSLTLNGPGALYLGGNNSYSGGTTINGGLLSGTADASFGANGTNITINSGTLQFGGAVNSSHTYTLAGIASFDVTGSNVVQISNIGGLGALTKVDTGTLLLLSGTPNQYAGGTNINAGFLSISNDNSLGATSGALNITGGTLITTADVSSSRSGTIASGAISTANTVSLAGNFSGNGPLTITGGGTVSLTGSNGYGTGTTITGNSTLTGNTNGLQGALTVNAGSALIFAQNFTGTYAGTLAGSGTLTINSSGSNVIFTGNSSAFTGPTTIAAGTLIVDGNLTGSALSVTSSGILRGTGFVGSTTSTGGTVYPGDGTGALTIMGNLTLNSTSNVIIDITPTTADQLVVTGTAALNHSALTINPSAGFYAPITCYTILNAGMTTGSFAPPTSTNSNFTFTLSNNDSILCARAVNLFFNFPFSNPNTAAVGNNINALNQANQITPGMGEVLQLFVALDPEDPINAALDEMHPAPMSAFVELEEEVNAQIISLFHRKPTLSNDCDCSTNRLWVEGFANGLRERNHGFQFGFDETSLGVAMGLDREVAYDWVIGLGGAWSNNHLGWHNGHGKGEVNGIYGAVYSDYQIWNFYLGAAVLGGVDWYDTHRHIIISTLNEHANASFLGYDITGQLSMAYFFGNPAAYFYPYANFDFLYTHLYPFTETGAPGLNLTVQSHTASTVRSEVGLAFQVIDKNRAETCSIAPLISLGYVNMSPIERQNFHSHFEGTTIPFTTFGWDQTWNLFSLDFGLAITYLCYSFNLNYNFELSPDSHTTFFNQNGTFRFDWNW